jgi:LmbE family N-acetylglucosaminyl deacetylase
MNAPDRLRIALASSLIATLAAACGAPRHPVEAVERHAITAVPSAARPRILCVVAHPDDEISFAGTLYKAATHLGAACDVLTITNGEAGYKYSTLAERVYGLELTDPEVGRRELPAIRREELRRGLADLAVRDLYMLLERDDGYSQDRAPVLDPATSPWDLERVRRVLREVLAFGDYDFVLTHLLSLETHGHHQVATLLAIEAVAERPQGSRPVILGARGGTKEEAATRAPYAGIEGEPMAAPLAGSKPFVFDRLQKFGFDERLDYRVVVNWAIAAHKSQGTMQLGMNRGELEEYWLYAVNDPAAPERAAAFFARLAEPQFEARDYPGAVRRR